MLSCYAGQAVTALLIGADATITGPADPLLIALTGWPARPVLAPISCRLWHTHPGGVPGLLAAVAAALTHPHPTTSPAVEVIGRDIHRTVTPARLIAWAVLYDDLHPEATGIHPVRRVDAVDIDQRVYQLVRHDDQAAGLVVVDDTPDPDDTPATQPALSRLVAACHRSTAPRHP
jgi:hypothetical protein